MAFDWEKFKDELVGESEWDDAEDLSRFSLESFIAEHNPLRRNASSGLLRLTGAGISGSSGPIDGVSDALRNLQRLVLATGMSLSGLKSLQGSAPTALANKTRLNLHGSPIPGSLIFEIAPAMPPSEEIAPTGQVNMFGDNDTQLVDRAMKEALSLLEEGKRFGASPDESDFLSRLNASGPRVASSLRDFTDGLARFEFEPTVTWLQPRYPKVKTSLVVPELARISEAIGTNELEVEPTTIRGVLRTVSEIGPWQIETGEKQLVAINASHIPASATSTLRTGMYLLVNASAVQKSGPASNPKTEYTAISFEILD